MAKATPHHYALRVHREPHFHFFGVPVHVEPFHLIIAGLFGYMRHRDLAGSTFISAVLIYVGMQFSAVLLHEMGHALVGRRFGLEPYVSLTGMGGLTSWLSARLLTPGQSILVSFAGPAVGLALGLAVKTPTRTKPLLI